MKKKAKEKRAAKGDIVPADPQNDSDSRGRRGLYGAALTAALLLAALPRLFRLNFDLPEVVWVDSFKFIDQAARMAARGDFQPALLQYPGFYPGLLSVIYRAFGIWNRTGQCLAGYYVTAFFAIGTVAAAWFLAGRIGGLKARFAAAALSALCLTSVVYSRTCSTDCALAFFMTCALALLARPPGNLRGFALAGAFAGLAAGTKFTGLFLLPFLAAAAAWAGFRERSWRSALVRAGVGLGVCAGIFILTTPYFIPLLGPYLHRMAMEARSQAAGMVGQINGSWFDALFSRTPAWETPSLGTSLLANLGAAGLIIAAGAVILALSARAGASALFVAVYLLAYLLVISVPGHIKTPRFHVPALPALYALMGCFIEFAAGRAGRWRRAAFIALLLAVAAVPGMKVLRYLKCLSAPSTNAMARKWAEANIPPGSVVFLAPFYTDDLSALPYRFMAMDRPGKRMFGRPPEGVPDPETLPPYTPEFTRELQDSGVRYLVLNSCFNGAFSPVPENIDRFPRAVAGYKDFLEDLGLRADRVWSVTGWAGGRLGPDIDIYKLRGAGSHAPSLY